MQRLSSKDIIFAHKCRTATPKLQKLEGREGTRFDPSFVHVSAIPGLKYSFWQQVLTEDFVKIYDYIWLIDSDMKFGIRHFDLERYFLAVVESSVLIAQPMIKPWGQWYVLIRVHEYVPKSSWCASRIG